MSWIMDRLRHVEGASSSQTPRGTRSSGGPATRKRGGQPTMRAGETGTSAHPALRGGAGSGIGFRVWVRVGVPVAIGFVVILAAFILWKPWKAGTSPDNPPRFGRGGTRGSGRVAAGIPAGEAGEGEHSNLIAELATSAPQGGVSEKEPPEEVASRPSEEGGLEVALAPSGQGSREDTQPTAADEVQVRLLTPEEDQRTKSFLLSMKLNGVYKDADGYIALINGHGFREGDRVGQTEIERITSERITFGYKGKKYHLPIR